MYEKQELNQENRRYFLLRTMLNGLRNTLSGKRFVLFFSIELALLGLLWLWRSLSPAPLIGLVTSTTQFVFLFAQPMILYACGYLVGSNRIYRDFVRIGLVNFANEAPVLVYKELAENGVQELHFFSKGVTIAKWQEAYDAVQSALDMTVVSIEPGKNHRTIIVRAVPTSDVLNQVLPWGARYVDFQHPTRFCIGLDAAGLPVEYDINTMPMGLIAGSTGSGKTSLAKVILIAAALRNYSVYVLDFKGLDFYYLHDRYGVTVHTDMQEILNTLQHLENGIAERKALFLRVGAKDLLDYCEKTGDTSMRRILIYVDECAMLTDYGLTKEAKKASADIVDKLAAIARIGRAFGVHLLVATQRPDANAVPGSIKSNLDLRICGKADATLSTIVLGDGRANELIAKSSVGLFLMSDGNQNTLFKAFYLDDSSANLP